MRRQGQAPALGRARVALITRPGAGACWQSHRSELEPADLAHAGPGERFDQVPVARAGGRRQVALRPLREVADGRRMLRVTRDDVGDGHHVADRIGTSENGALEDPGRLGEGGLDLGQADVLAGYLYHVVAPSDEAERA